MKQQAHSILAVSVTIDDDSRKEARVVPNSLNGISMKHKADLKQEWVDLAPAWIEESREGRNAARVGLLDKSMTQACGSVRDL
jgi:hypothetical protein